jgi:hypothetical protein
MKRRKNPVSPSFADSISREDLFSMAGAALGSTLGKWAANYKPPEFKPFKPNAVVALKMLGVCIHCSGRAAHLKRAFVSPGELRVFGRTCRFCGRTLK